MIPPTQLIEATIAISSIVNGPEGTGESCDCRILKAGDSHPNDAPYEN